MRDRFFYPDVGDQLADWVADRRGSLGSNLREWLTIRRLGLEQLKLDRLSGPCQDS